jgi:hypothetical protein
MFGFLDTVSLVVALMVLVAILIALASFAMRRSLIDRDGKSQC